jgi:replicative DNA helicase
MTFDLGGAATKPGPTSTPSQPAAWEATVDLATLVDELEGELHGPAPRAVRTPFHRLNVHLGGGFFPGELIGLGARPGLGKSAFMAVTATAAARDGERVLVVSAEMSRLALVRRLVAREASVDSRLIRKHDLMDTEWARLREAFPALRALPVLVNDRARTIPEIVEVLTRAPQRVTFLCVDYVQLVTPAQRIESQRMKVELVSAGLKAIAKDFGIPVLALSAVKRLGRDEEGNDNEPDLDAFRESGQIDHDVDVAMFLHRPHRDDKTCVRCFIRKARDGAEGYVDLVFTPEFLQLEEALTGGAR